MSAPRSLDEAAVHRARRNLLNEVAVGRLHLHLRACSTGHKTSTAVWCVAFYRTALCGTKRCFWVIKKAKE